MNLNGVTFWLLISLLLTPITSAQQATKADLQALESKLTATITEMDKRLIRLETKVDEMDRRLTTRIDELDRHISRLINILIGVVLAAIALPQVLGYFQGRRERAELKREIQEWGGRLERQQHEIFEKMSQQQQEIEEIKSRRVIPTA